MDKKPMTEGMMDRQRFMKLSAAGLAGAALLGAPGIGSTAQGAVRRASAASARTLTLGDIGWDENIANANLTKLLLEDDLGYSTVRLQLADVGILFEGVARGDLAAFEDVWMPNHTAYLNRVKDSVELLPPWYEGTTKFSMAVPSYMHVTSITQLNSTNAKVIYGIEPGAVITTKIRDNVIPEYHLKQQFLPSSTPAMLAQVAKAYKAREAFVFIAWSPHWMNAKYNITYLADPKGALGNLTKPSRLSTIVHKGLKESDPVAYTLLRSMRLTAKQVNDMELEINRASDPLKGVQTWLHANQAVVQPWVQAAKKAARRA
jgi:glycine betaine/proline transport system substrate-binding protein